MPHWFGIPHPGGSTEDLLDVAEETWQSTGIPGLFSFGDNDYELEEEGVTGAVEDVEDKEKVGDELRAKQGTDVGIPVIYGTRRIGGILVYQEVEEDTGKGINELMNLYHASIIHGARLFLL